MKNSTKDRLEGKYHEAKGKIKEAAGNLTDNRQLKNEGQDEKITGKAQHKVGNVKKSFDH